MQALHLICVLVAAATVWTAGAGAAEIRLFAAASLADALKEVLPGFEETSVHVVQLNLGGSGLLQRQIEAGAPADVFFSADVTRVDRLEEGGHVLPGSRRYLLSNQLVLVIPIRGGSAVATISDLASPAVRRVALGDPDYVPVGAYARAFLERQGIWMAVKPKVVPLDNVRAVLAAVAAGNADAGFVYRTDAAIEPRVRIVLAAPAGEGLEIVYPAVVVKQSREPGAAQALLDFLAAESAQEIFRRFGFLPVDPAADP
jgi:molybdate transport system substrate-binding protein